MKKFILAATLLLPLAHAQQTPAEAQTAETAFKTLEPLTKDRVLKFSEPQWVINPNKKYRAIINTTKGDITVELYPKIAPKAVNSFVFLALNHYYDGIVFHRVLDNFMAQTGDPTGTGTGGPGYSYGLEIEQNVTFNAAGLLGVANSGGRSTNGSQFFITFAPASWLNYGYTIFGKVLDGMPTVNSIQKIDPQKPDPKIKPDAINTVTILESN
ncbi:peptidylprolyl isomerase [Deinococcus roseus]|uniref:Peptidyl-prolyl cis-trans isomerase n=1 Tax=Deinococcus roseus TaxID=392414 RepID=A0ABQ2CW46_9DEIO|nr:peptidylprolyl isomerase [Deinococcus roseus]GGJ25439.1 hypothetical protein GCM10008938_09380 [Deinococcus roseus]